MCKRTVELLNFTIHVTKGNPVVKELTQDYITVLLITASFSLGTHSADRIKLSLKEDGLFKQVVFRTGLTICVLTSGSCVLSIPSLNSTHVLFTKE